MKYWHVCRYCKFCQPPIYTCIIYFASKLNDNGTRGREEGKEGGRGREGVMEGGREGGRSHISYNTVKY